MTEHERIQAACQSFIKALEFGKVILNSEVFATLSETASLAGYRLEAHQQGIRGTHIVFTKED